MTGKANSRGAGSCAAQHIHVLTHSGGACLFSSSRRQATYYPLLAILIMQPATTVWLDTASAYLQVLQGARASARDISRGLMTLIMI